MPDLWLGQQWTLGGVLHPRQQCHQVTEHPPRPPQHKHKLQRCDKTPASVSSLQQQHRNTFPHINLLYLLNQILFRSMTPLPNNLSNCLIPITFSPLLTPASQTPPLTPNLPPPAPLSSTLLPSRHSTRHPPIVGLDPSDPPADGGPETMTFCWGRRVVWGGGGGGSVSYRFLHFARVRMGIPKKKRKKACSTTLKKEFLFLHGEGNFRISFVSTTGGNP